MRFIIAWISLLVLMLFVGCSDLSVAPTPGQTDAEKPPTLVFQDQRDPFELSSVKEAMASLVTQKTGAAKLASDIKITHNYLYVKFTTFDIHEAGKLQNWDTSLVLQEFPLDKKIISYGRDTTLPDNVRKFYTAIPVGYNCCPGTKCDTLKKLVLTNLPGLTNNLAKTKLNATIKELSSYGISPMELEYTTLKMSGDSRVDDVNPNALAKLGGFRPTGTIKYTDNIRKDANGVFLTYPCEGARVTYGYSYYWKEARLNSSGYFCGTDGWTWGVDYHLHFDAADFELKNYNMFEGPEGKKEAWNKTFSATDFWSRIAVTFDACWQWWYRDMGGLSRPHQNSWHNFKLAINCYNRYEERGKGKFFVGYLYGWEWIDLFFQWSPGVQVNSAQAYTSAIHEIAHNDHMENLVTRNPLLPKYDEFALNVEPVVAESFASGVALYFGWKRYPGTGTKSPESWGYTEFWAEMFVPGYAPIMVDLIDNDESYPTWTWGDDYVSGYTLSDMKTYYRSFTWGELSRNLWTLRSSSVLIT